MSSRENQYSIKTNKIYLAIGNSRLHWAWFKDSVLIENWDTPHLSNKVIGDRLPLELLSDNLSEQNLTAIPVNLASVVPQQTELWQNYINLNVITLKDIGLKNIYPTMGIDRALAVWGGGETYGYPCLVIDGGTALTFTGVDRQQQLIGGAIFPGLRSQLTNINQKTAALPQIDLPTTLPPRWAMNTEGAIASGIIHTIVAGIHSYITDWQQQYSDSPIIFTGGDAQILTQYLRAQHPPVRVITDPHLIFWGINLCT